MIVTCEACSARYKLDDAKVSAKGAKITCPRCRHVFVVYKKSEAAGASGGHEVKLGRPSKKKSAENLDFRKVGIASWKVKVKIGLVYDFSDLKTLRKYIADGRVTSDDAISFDGKRWTTIGDIPDLDAYFVKVYEDAEARISGPSGSDGFAEDEPTTIASDSSLATNLARMALAQVENEDAELPSPSPGARPLPPPSGAPTSSQFVDPFAALKDKQRERIAQKRASTNDLASRGGQGGSNKGALAVAFIVVVGVAGYLYTSSQSPATSATNVTPAPTTAAAAPTPAPTPPPLTAEDIGFVKEVEVEPSDTGEEDEYDQEDLVAVVPEHVRNGGTNASAYPPRPVYAAPTTAAGTAPAQPPAIQVSAITPSDHIAAGDSMSGQGNFSGAAAAYQQALAMQPSAGVQVKAGWALYKAGQYDQSASLLRGATSVPEAYKWLARVAKAQGDVSGANGYYQQYLSTNPADAAEIQAEMQSLM